jgi:hypothetical protein
MKGPAVKGPAVTGPFCNLVISPFDMTQSNRLRQHAPAAIIDSDRPSLWLYDEWIHRDRSG